ncbi:MAG: bifunctional (p)ppGpp synthetase/guanosine-3',5'-bis(diphosphate) 3'-pyrophosphohydrolase [Chloroflexi bacterium]|nr:bifunctional (p)ppGpp synthetase/guanosine-3',5'-bis(diphosphate) 3'-pyrophosphohydrolase [Chloroflexota bacterium]
MNKVDLISRISEYLPSDRVEFVATAYDYSAQCHEGQYRLSGEPYLQHPLYAAMQLAKLKLDATCIASALLHDVMEDCDVSLEELEKRFGPEVGMLVNGVSKLTRLELQAIYPNSGSNGNVHDSTAQAENLRKMLVAMAQDIRVVLIKLVDRHHNMRTLKFLPRERQLRIARETLDIYAPLADRLGMADLKWQLEDLSFRTLQPDRYREITRLITQRRGMRERYVAQVTRVLTEALGKAGVKANVTGRPKHIYSIHQKMNRYAEQGKEFDQIYDLFALRVLVDRDRVQDCYAALGVVHGLWRPIPGQFDDYVANPRENGYQSLHTTVMTGGGVPLEIQIRTSEMHVVSEFGIAAHWRYKEGVKGDSHFEDRLAWVRQRLLDWQSELSRPEEFVQSVKTDILPDQVFVYTPKGDVKELPAGSTPIDFAYLIHTDIGNQCSGAKVNGKLTSLDYQLQNGDMVQMLTSNKIRGPRLDWLNPDLGYVKTANARQAIRVWFRRQRRAENIERGQELVDKELRRLALTFTLNDLARQFKYSSREDFLAALGSGTISIHQVANTLSPPERPVVKDTVGRSRDGRPVRGVTVLGVEDVLTRLARCCNPLPGDQIMGFITRSQGVTVHKRDCHNVVDVQEQERLIQVEWGSTPQLYPVRIQLEGKDRVGLLRDITTVVSAEKVNISGVMTEVHGDGTVTEYLNLETSGIGQLSRIFTRLEKVGGVLRVSRSEHPPRAESGSKTKRGEDSGGL